jgi:hypothetical protein
MIVNTSVSTNDIFNTCKTQTSYDFQALRSKNADVGNADYDYWVMMDFDSNNLYTVFQETAMSLYNALRQYIVSFSAGSDEIAAQLQVYHDRPNTESAMNLSMQSYYKNSVLAWWFAYREPELSKVYAEKALGSLDAIMNLCLPKTGTIKSRYF